MKKVTILSLHLGYGGIEKSIVALANLLCEKYKVEIACVYKLFDKPVFKIDDRVMINYLTDVVPNHEGIREAKKNKKVVKLIKEYSYGAKVLIKRRNSMVDYIIHCDSDYIISTRDIFNDWLGTYGNRDSIKIGWEHNHYHDNYRYADNVVRSAKKLDYFVLVSRNLRDYYSKRLRKYNVKCFFIPNIVDKLPKEMAPLKEKRLVSVGRLSPEKGYMDLLKIFKLLHQDHKDWTLDIIGDGKEKDKLEDYISKNKLDKFITLHGYRDKEYIDKVLHKSSLYIMTSHTESFGIVLIEAMSHGIPCIAYDSAEGANELIISGKNGYLIHNRNQEMMIKKIEDLMKDFNARKRIGKNSRDFSKQFIGENVINKWITLLDEGEVYEEE